MLWHYALAFLLAAEVSEVLTGLFIDGCPELYEIVIAQMGSEDVDPALLQTISSHCLTSRLA